MAIDALPSSPRPARLEVLGRLGLHDGSGEEVTAILKGAKRLALLSYLVLARGDGFHRRDRLLALFWPESPADQARGSLRQALHSLRRSLGPGVIEGRGDEELRADPALIWCDALEFERLAQPGREVEALRLYRGPLLDGFHAPDVSPEFERWLEAERDRLNRLAVTLAWQRAASCEREGSPLEAARWARHAVALLPDDEPGVRRLMQLLDRLGDRAGALAAYADFTTRLRAEYDSDAAPETRRLAAEFRRRASPARPSPEPVLPARVPSAPVAAPRPGPRPGRALLAAGCLLAVTLGAGLWVRLRATAPVPVLAVGAIGEPSVPDSAHLAQSIPDLLATNLARLPDVRVVSRIRLYDLMGQVGDSVLTPELTARLARRAGATELVEGTFYRTGRDSFRLDLRRVDLATGTVRRAYTARGTSVFELADGATRELAADLQVRTAVTATGTGEGSLSARRLFDEGLRRYYTGGIREAGDLFESALGEDSTFALAAYYAAVSRGWEDPFEALELLRRAVRLGDHATQRDRLTIQLAWAIRTNDTAMVTLADSLSRRYPDDPETRFAAGEAHAWAGDPWGALPHFRRVITLDSAGLLGTVPRCRACDAYAGLASAYLQLDSLAAAERALREMLAARPDWTRGWMDLGRVLAQEGRGTDAMATLRAGGRSLQQPTGEVFGAELQLILGNTADAEQQLAGMARYGSQATRREALWLLVIAERYRGRLAGALAAARQLRALDDSMPGGETVHFDGRVAEAQVRLEMGDGAGAARLFAMLAAQSPLAGAEITGVRARKRAFDLARLAMALDATGDTIQLPGLADSVRVWGRRSAYSRDRTLAPHLDGLIARRRGDLDSAARAFRSALVLPGTGLSRTNYELARVALAQGRAAAAIGPLQAILHRDIQGSNFYLTMPEAHLLLAEAFDSAGLADSAAAHYRVVARSWAGGDPPFRARAAHAERRIRQLTF